jgi:hypothetical protein
MQMHISSLQPKNILIWTYARITSFLKFWTWSLSGPNPLGLATIFYCLRFETFLFVTSWDSQGHGGGIRPRLHTGLLSRPGRVFRAEQRRAVAYCWQPASTVTPGIEPRWDPWPYICSMSTHLLFSFFVVPPLIKMEGLDFFYNWCSLTTPYATQDHIKVGDIYILYIIHKTQTDTKFYYIQGHANAG